MVAPPFADYSPFPETPTAPPNFQPPSHFSTERIKNLSPRTSYFILAPQEALKVSMCKYRSAGTFWDFHHNVPHSHPSSGETTWKPMVAFGDVHKGPEGKSHIDPSLSNVMPPSPYQYFPLTNTFPLPILSPYQYFPLTNTTSSQFTQNLSP